MFDDETWSRRREPSPTLADLFHLPVGLSEQSQSVRAHQ
jgi:hypothetical protein